MFKSKSFKDYVTRTSRNTYAPKVFNDKTKKRTIEDEIAKIKNIEYKARHAYFGLVGPALTPHYKNAKKVGFTKMLVPEISITTLQLMKQDPIYSKCDGYIQIIHDEFFDVLENELIKGTLITDIDFDATCTASTVEHELPLFVNLLNTYHKNLSEVFGVTLTFTPRRNIGSVPDIVREKFLNIVQNSTHFGITDVYFQIYQDLHGQTMHTFFILIDKTATGNLHFTSKSVYKPLLIGHNK